MTQHAAEKCMTNFAQDGVHRLGPHDDDIWWWTGGCMKNKKKGSAKVQGYKRAEEVEQVLPRFPPQPTVAAKSSSTVATTTTDPASWIGPPGHLISKYGPLDDWWAGNIPEDGVRQPTGDGWHTTSGPPSHLVFEHGNGVGTHNLALSCFWSAPASTLERVRQGDTFVAGSRATFKQWQKQADEMAKF